MAQFAVVYGSKEGQTKKIAERIAAIARQSGHAARVVDGRSLPDDFVLDNFDAAIVGASIHAGNYPGYIVDFVKQHHSYVSRTPSAFFTVCLTAATPTATNMAQVHKLVAEFEQQTGWQPAKVGTFAGALRYTQYGLLKRFVMKAIASRAGEDTDTSRDYEYTDWDAVTRFAEAYFGAVDWAITPFAAA